MSKGQTLQDPFLNTLRKDRIPVSIFLVNGIKLQGQIESFDQYVVLLKNTVSQMVYKHAISTVVPARNPRSTGTTTTSSSMQSGFQGDGLASGMNPAMSGSFDRSSQGYNQGGGFSRGGFAERERGGFTRSGFTQERSSTAGFDRGGFTQERGSAGFEPAGAGFASQATGGFERSGFEDRGFEDRGFEAPAEKTDGDK